jgi:hypothetical protein
MAATNQAEIQPTTAGEQIARVARYFRKLKEYEAGLPIETLVSNEHQDVTYAFFLNCYHLKDWIKADPVLSELGNVEAFINGSFELRLCADICNASKHFELTKPRSDQNPAISLPTIMMDQRGDKVVVRYNVKTTSGSIDSFELAQSCMSAWSQFLRFDVSIWFGVDIRICM